MLNKSAVKISISIMSLLVFLSFPVGAFWPFSSSEAAENPTAEGLKESFENSKEELELSKNKYKELVARIKDEIFQFEANLNDFKRSRDSLEEQLNKLADAYKEWAQNNYILVGDTYKKFVFEKEQFDKIVCMVKIKEDILKAFFSDNLLALSKEDSEIYSKYKEDMNNSIDLYYKYGLLMAKGMSRTA